MTPPPIRRFDATRFGWDDVERVAYKTDAGAPFRDVTRQTLFRRDDMAGELRYFEIGAGGHSTLERHRHAHAVLVLRGRGQCLVGTDIHDLGANDLVTVPPLTWHQFRAAADVPLGFLCMVDQARDRPALPDDATLAALRADPAIEAFLAGDGSHR